MGKYVTLGTTHPVGYCCFHKSTLSVKQMQAKECLDKQCNHFVRMNSCYWASIDAKKQKSKENRKQKKERQKEYFRMVDTKRIIREIEYCHNCPPEQEEQLEYCAMCPYSKKCLPGLIEEFYEYLKKYERNNKKKLDKIFVK